VPTISLKFSLGFWIIWLENFLLFLSY
jgi:hypothetical protein